MDYNTATPAEFDAEYVEHLTELAKAEATVTNSIEALHRYVGDDGKKVWIGRHSHTQYSLSYDEVMTRANAGEFTPAYNADPGKRTLERYRAAKDRKEQLQAHLAMMDNVYRARGRWSRFFLVQDGHIHSSMNCSTCNKNGKATDFGWLTSMSGRTEADCVAEHGALLCTVCFPSAPVEWTNKLELDAAAKKAAQCPGSGKSPAPNDRPRQRYQPCSACGTHQNVTSTGIIRSHKPPKEA